MRNINTNKKEILDKGLKVFSIRVLGYGFGFLFTLIVANKYGARVQGVFAIAFLFLSIGAMISKLGMETSLVKWIASTLEIEVKKNLYIKSLQLTIFNSVLIGFVLYFLAPSIALMYNKPDVENSIKLAALAIPFLAILDVSGSYFKGEKKTNTFGMYFHFAKFLFPFIIILIFLYGSIYIIEAPILAYLIGLFMVSFVIMIHIFKILKGKPRKINERFSFKFMFLESYPMMVSSAIVMIMGWSDVFILGFYASEEQIGVYSTAIKLATVVSFTYNAIATIATPKIAAYYHNNKSEELKETVAFSSKMMVYCGFPIFTVIFCFPEFILSFFGEEYVAGKTVLRILLFAQLTNVITGPVGPIFQMTGHQKKLQKIITMSLIFNIVLSLVLVRFFKMEGVALASAAGMMLWNVLGAYYIRKRLNIRTWVKF
ncbi:flippase [Bizionia gelidisalsuginis]|uniref:Flippase n=1 Tax=Bizionia gelidisalsuginis TaxID=291188 RepID=A0ABY3MCR7_9FLAO|nr:flippase [Bizionia gelidisalsuginis]TYC15651.1 flippase [Bizionia gelidisalsuginis]